MIGSIALGTCGGCKFYRTVGEEKACTRFPPMAQMVPTGPQSAEIRSFFPTVRPDWTCGEHKPRLAS